MIINIHLLDWVPLDKRERLWAADFWLPLLTQYISDQCVLHLLDDALPSVISAEYNLHTLRTIIGIYSTDIRYTVQSIISKGFFLNFWCSSEQVRLRGVPDIFSSLLSNLSILVSLFALLVKTDKRNTEQRHHDTRHDNIRHPHPRLICYFFCIKSFGLDQFFCWILHPQQLNIQIPVI